MFGTVATNVGIVAQLSSPVVDSSPPDSVVSAVPQSSGQAAGHSPISGTPLPHSGSPPDVWESLSAVSVSPVSVPEAEAPPHMHGSKKPPPSSQTCTPMVPSGHGHVTCMPGAHAPPLLSLSLSPPSPQAMAMPQTRPNSGAKR
jgi:hypothetical protein